MCDVLAKGREGEPEGTPPAKLSLEHVVALKPLLPLNNAFQLLVQPLPARGLGLRLKRALGRPLWNCIMARAWPECTLFKSFHISVLLLNDHFCCKLDAIDCSFGSWGFRKAEMAQLTSVIKRAIKRRNSIDSFRQCRHIY